MTNETILFIDTALQATCVGLYHNDKHHKNIVPEPRGAAERLMPMIETIMADADCTPLDLNTIITTRGPGSFTGLRVGLSVVQTMPIALDVQTLGLSTFDAVALSSALDAPFCVLLESKRKDFYVQTYGTNTPYHTPQTAMAEDIVGAIGNKPITGDGCDRFIELTGYKGTHHPCAIPESAKIIDAYIHGHDGFTDDISPIYLRDADVSFPKAK